MRRWLILAFCFLIASVLHADNVGQNKASDVAVNFYNATWSPETIIDVSYIQDVDHIISGRDTLLYLFRFNDDRFVVVAADNAAYPVPAYGSNARDWNDAHTSVKGWMRKYKGEMKLIIQRELKAGKRTEEMWKTLSAGNYKNSSRGSAPLLLSTWNQNWPYNALAPAAQSGSGGHTFVGCVAVSMGQVMYYYRYPASGNGSHSYYHYQYGTLQANFGNAVYEYYDMVDDLNGKENDEVAELLYHCAVSVDMNFSPNGSGASMNAAINSMKNYFNYSSSSVLESKNNYSNSQWKTMIRNEIDNNRPMLYSGYPDNGAGHAFNLDGYQGSDHFHFNWGWSGSYDGYYYLDALHPGASDFTFYQSGSFFVEPGPNYPAYCNSQSLTAMRGTFEDGSGHQKYISNASCSWLINPKDTTSHIDLDFKQVDLQPQKDFIRVYDGKTSSDSLLAEITGDSIPQTISSGGSHLYVTFDTDNDTNYQGFHASYKAYSPVYCNSTTIMSSPTGLISDGSGGYPYHNDTKCRWFINPSGASWVKASFTKLDTYSSNDFVAFYDPSTTPGTFLGKYYGNNKPGPITSGSGQMLVMFSSNGTEIADGFELEYTTDLVGTQEHTAEDFAVYPNPSKGKVNIDIPQGFTYEKIEIFDAQGKKVASFIDRNKIRKRFSPGIYYIRVISEETLEIKKLIISGNE